MLIVYVTYTFFYGTSDKCFAETFEAALLDENPKINSLIPGSFGLFDLYISTKREDLDGAHSIVLKLWK